MQEEGEAMENILQVGVGWVGVCLYLQAELDVMARALAAQL